MYRGCIEFQAHRRDVGDALMYAMRCRLDSLGDIKDVEYVYIYIYLFINIFRS